MDYGVHIKVKLDSNECVPTEIASIIQSICPNIDLSVITDIMQETDKNENEFTTGVVFYNRDSSEFDIEGEFEEFRDELAYYENALRAALDFGNNENILFCETYSY